MTDPIRAKPAISMLKVHGFPRERDRVCTRGTCGLSGRSKKCSGHWSAPAWNPAHELSAAAYCALSPFEQIPAVNGDAIVLSESAAMVIDLAKKSGKLIAGDPVGEAQLHSNGEGRVDFP